MNTPRNARQRVRAEMTREIIQAAQRQLSEVGAAGLSLRAIARELGMVSSGIYRYFRNRDELLTALIMDGYDAIGGHAETADVDAISRQLTPTQRWVAVSHAVRGWALDHPHEFALLYGTPVPGYAAPRETAVAAARLPLTLSRIIADALAAGSLDPAAMPECPAELFDPETREQVPAIVDSTMLSRLLLQWMGLMGHISFELFGHLFNIVTDFDAYFDHAAHAAARNLGLPD